MSYEPQKTMVAKSKPVMSSQETESIEQQFATKYGFVKDGQCEIDKDRMLRTLQFTFFRTQTKQGTAIGYHHFLQVMVVALETGLNPFNNDLFPIFTNFGDLRIFATIQGWYKIASLDALTDRYFKYSDQIVKVQRTYCNEQVDIEVPSWVECYLEHEVKGQSVAREYFIENYYPTKDVHTLSWDRPARMLAHMAFIQAYRRLNSLSCLSDTDMVIALADYEQEYEASNAVKKWESVQHQSASEVTSEIDIPLDSVIIEEDVPLSFSPTTTTLADEVESISIVEPVVQNDGECCIVDTNIKADTDNESPIEPTANSLPHQGKVTFPEHTQIDEMDLDPSTLQILKMALSNPNVDINDYLGALDQGSPEFQWLQQQVTEL